MSTRRRRISFTRSCKVTPLPCCATPTLTHVRQQQQLVLFPLMAVARREPICYHDLLYLQTADTDLNRLLSGCSGTAKGNEGQFLTFPRTNRRRATNATRNSRKVGNSLLENVMEVSKSTKLFLCTLQRPHSICAKPENSYESRKG
jgi:hypothetical protein